MAQSFKRRTGWRAAPPGFVGRLAYRLAVSCGIVLNAAEPAVLNRDRGLSPAVPKIEAETAALKEDAVETAAQLAKAYPEDSLAYALLGAAYYNVGRSGEATKHLQKCLELNPNQADAYEILARVAYEKGNLEESAQLCREALKRGPANPDVLNQLGRALMDLGKTDEAIQGLQQAAGIPNAPSQSFYWLGQAYLQAGNFVQGKINFQKAIAILPDHTQAYFALYRACQALGQTEEAQRHREQFVKLEAIDRNSLTEQSAQMDTLTGLPQVQTTVARTFFGAAQVYRLHHQPAQAAELFQKAASLDTGNGSYRTALESHFVQSKMLPEGVAAFEKLSAGQPTNHLNQFFLGRLHARLDHLEAAVNAFRKVQELAPKWAEGYRALADLEVRSNRNLSEALTLARKAAELEPTAPHFYLLAVAGVKNNDRAGALEAIKRAVAMAPGEKRYREILEQISQAP